MLSHLFCGRTHACVSGALPLFLPQSHHSPPPTGERSRTCAAADAAANAGAGAGARARAGAASKTIGYGGAGREGVKAKRAAAPQTAQQSAFLLPGSATRTVTPCLSGQPVPQRAWITPLQTSPAQIPFRHCLPSRPMQLSCQHATQALPAPPRSRRGPGRGWDRCCVREDRLRLRKGALHKARLAAAPGLAGLGVHPPPGRLFAARAGAAKRPPAWGLGL